MDHIDILQEMLRYIDAHIKEKMNVEKLAARAGFSPYHFCRIFQWSVGYSIMEYVRNRRLAFAATELNSGRRIIDIVVDYGFETHTGFTKAFRRHFGCSPEIWGTSSPSSLYGGKPPFYLCISYSCIIRYTKIAYP